MKLLKKKNGTHIQEKPAGEKGGEKKPPFLLFRLMDSPWPRDEAHRVRRELWNLLLLVLGVLALECVSLLITGEAVTGLFGAYFASPLVLLLNLAPLLLLALLLYALTGIVSLSAGLPGVLLLVLTLINAIKTSFRGDPFVFSDIFLAGEAGDMMSSYKLHFTAVEIAGMVLTVLIILALVLLTGKNLLHGRWPFRGAVVIVSGVLLAALLCGVYPSNQLYKSTYAGADLVSTRSDSQFYSAHGFTYAFLHSAVKPAETVVEYDEEEMTAQAETLTVDTSDIPEDKKVNLIMVQLEAYCDLSQYCDSEALAEAYAPLHAIQETAVTGNLIDNIFGGGTVNTERSVITGYTVLPEFTEKTNSYAWYLMSQGYTVQGSHPGYNWFYDRETINANLGFEHYYFSENHYEELVSVESAPWHSDDVLFDEIVNLMEASDGPYFSLDVSYQNHGPYESGSYSGETEYFTEEDCADEAARNILNNYVNLVASTNQEMLKLVERLEAMEEPVVLVMFGDHKPYLGNGEVDGYEALGINMDVSTDEGFLNTYSTPYFIWANSAAKAALGNDFMEDGGDFGSCFLMNKVFELCGWTGNAFMQASNTLFETVQAVHSAVEVYYQNGSFVDSLSEEDQAVLDTFLAFQSYWQTNFQYEDAAEASEARLAAEAEAEAQAQAEAEAEAAAAAEAEAEAQAQQQQGQQQSTGTTQTQTTATQSPQTSSPSTSEGDSGGTTGTNGGGTTTQTPVTDSPGDTSQPTATDAPATESPSTPAETQSPTATEAPTQEPATQEPATQEPETSAAQTTAPQTSTPQTSAPQTAAPQTQTPAEVPAAAEGTAESVE